MTPAVCAVLVEPIQGEAGIILPPAGYLRDLREICHRHNVLLMVDEIQSGFGRAGTMFAVQYEHVSPDIMIVGKSLSGGFYPVSAVLASREVLGVVGPGDHGSTYGGNPLACAIARAALKSITAERLPERSATLGACLLERVRALRSEVVREARGRGLWIGLELISPRVRTVKH